MRKFIIMCGAAALSACGSGGGTAEGNQATAAKPKKEKPRYCFFKDDGTRAWKASRDKDGNVVVTGQAYRQDGRYKGTLGEPKVTGNKAELWAGVGSNDTGHSMPDGWWTVTATVPNSAAVDTVEVRCGKRALATLKVARKG